MISRTGYADTIDMLITPASHCQTRFQLKRRAFCIPVRSGMPDRQGADADQAAGAVHQPGAAELREGRTGVDRRIQQIFPAAGELAAAADGRRRHPAGAVMAQDQRLVADLQAGGVAQRQRPGIQRHQGPHQAEAGVEVVGQDFRRQPATAMIDDIYRGRFQDQIADGQDQTVLADHHAVAGPALAEDLGRHRIAGHGRFQPHGGAAQVLDRDATLRTLLRRGAVARQHERQQQEREDEDAVR